MFFGLKWRDTITFGAITIKATQVTSLDSLRFAIKKKTIQQNEGSLKLTIDIVGFEYFKTRVRYFWVLTKSKKYPI